MPRHPIWIVALCRPLAAGCYNTDRSKADARDLAKDLQAFRDAQDARVKRLNQEYQEAFSRLMDTLDDLSATELQQGRDADAQAIADVLIADTGGSLRSHFRGSFAQAIKDQRQRITDADIAVATVRADYQKAYADAKLQTSKIDAVMKDLLTVSQDPDDAAKVQEAIHFIKLVNASIKETKAKAKAAATQPSN